MYMFRIYDIFGGCRQIKVKSYDFAIERINHYKNDWKLFKFATLSHFDGLCWLEIGYFE